MHKKKKWYLNVTVLIILLAMVFLTAACGSSTGGDGSAAAQGQTRANANLVGSICQGTPLPEAPAYSQTSGTHPMSVLELGDDGNYKYGFYNFTTYRQPDGWDTSYVEALELVVCIDKEEEELVEECAYTLVDGGETVILNRYAQHVAFRLLEAHSGREIAADTLVGFPDECQETFEFVEGTTGSSMHGNVYDELEEWLRPYVEIP